MTEIREQITWMRQAGCGFCNYDISEIADTMEKLLVVYEAARALVSMDGLPSAVQFVLLKEALDEIQTRRAENKQTDHKGKPITYWGGKDSADSRQREHIYEKRPHPTLKHADVAICCHCDEPKYPADSRHVFAESLYRSDRCVVCQRPPGHPNHSAEQGGN